jgi:uncharacterized phage protein (TIGR01671 family)
MYDTNVNKMYMPNDFGGVESIYECIKQQINWDLDVDYDIKFNHLEDGRFFMQCTGLKDKNGKLIYEGDIVKYAEFDWTDFSFKDWETEIAQVVWGNTYDNYYPAFDLKDTDFDGTNAFAYLFNEGWTIEVIGNIYQDSHLLEN